MFKSVGCERCDEINDEDDTKDHDGKSYCYDCYDIVSKNKDIPASLRGAQMLAARKGGKCLSKKYVNVNSRMKWSCDHGHRWKTSLTSIKRGSWCSVCIGCKKLTLDDCQILATVHGGLCLSTEYINSSTSMMWQCGVGHQWKTRHNTIKMGSWCPVCANRVPLTLDECKEYAISMGGSCLSTEYINTNTKMSWMCQYGHKWMAVYGSMKYEKGWCPHCSGRAPLTIEECRLYAISKGGMCLSNNYINSDTSMKWSCSNGHTWKSTFGNIKHNNNWCTRCSNTARVTVEDYMEYAANKGGMCLSDECVGVKEKIKWQCAMGHIWDACFDSIKNGNSWCPTCAGRPSLTIQDCIVTAHSKNGVCLSKEYVNKETSMLWQCEKGHTWYATYGSIRNAHSWCAICIGCIRLTLEECQEWAKSMNGKCLSTKYRNTDTKMKWLCHNGHIWKANFDHIKNRGQWCPKCPMRYRSEETAREIMESVMQIPFNKEKPKWLKGLELDGYNKNNGIAFEYQGEQHYKHMKHWHRNGATLEGQQKRDRAKMRRCERRGVILIVIPYTFTYNDPDAMYEYIDEELDRQIKARVRKARQAQ